MVDCDSRAVPAAGQYVLAHAPADQDAMLAEPLFLQRKTNNGFLAAPLDTPLSPYWHLGSELSIRGQAGKGFQLPANLRNLALAAFGNTTARLLPLLNEAENAALFTDLPVRDLPMHVEIQPLSAMATAAGWADFIAMDVPLGRIQQAKQATQGLHAPSQLLVTTPMPCGGIADCGVCALTTHARKPLLLCVDGPVIPGERLQRSAAD